ncbi:MAG: 16S rRNA (adenine(1518)-N(6)/adenine(1519)-N(6))-dimethyltransferase RsmA [Treponema sp.]|nr:16S rRNA (adenine(1518)-N(6)/adenine(1519)-N(6))-dimethyltransferase RsmA [Treponema sp.]
MREPINYDSPSALRAFLEAEGLGARKQFGQNFLIRREIRMRLLDALEFESDDAVWEIGPGLGAMTAPLLERGAHITAFEIDEGFCRILRGLFGERLTLIQGDALATWRNTAAAPYLIGNLPYNIGARLIAEFIEQGRFFQRMVVTIQREVAQRMSARPHTKDYSSFSVLCASAYTVTPLMVLKGSCFYPAPHVDSQAVRLDLRPNRPRYPALFYPLIRALFSSRRKTVKHNLRDFIAQRSDSAVCLMDAAIVHCDIDAGARAENLSLEDFAALAIWLTDALQDQG